MTGFVDHDDEIISEINVTPLVDIILVLLIIFMVTATLMVNPAINVNLPRSASAENVPENAVSLVLDRHGRMFVNGQPVTQKLAGQMIREAVKKDPGTQVLIAADRGLKYQRVIDLVNIVNQAGVTNFALNVETYK